MEDDKKLLLGVVLALLIIAMGFSIYANRDKLFVNHINLTYSDGCVEQYINKELITPECTIGRQLEQEQVDNINKPRPITLENMKWIPDNVTT